MANHRPNRFRAAFEAVRADCWRNAFGGTKGGPRRRSIQLIMCCTVLLACACHRRAVVAVPAAPVTGDSHAAREFQEAVQKYVKLHRRIDASLPPLKSTKDLASIDERQKTLTKRICEARREAKQGDIFTPAVSAEFRAILADVFHGPDSAPARKTVAQGEPVSVTNLQVNSTYPEGIPVTTVPPSLLQNLPRLPQEVQYLIVGRFLVLQDVRANLIVDFMDGSIPGKVVR